ncbi:MAG: efflux RND transporter periplasmic adaptor subunit [Gammaproteobacteria bacterium]
MSESMFSPSWYRVAGLKPRLRSHAQIHRHDYRGAVWFVLQDHASGRFHRFTPAAHHVIGLMDGARTVQQIWDAAVEHLADDAPTQAEVIGLLAQLHAADVLQCDVPPNSLEVLSRHQRGTRMRWKRRFWSPLAIRIPLFDPERYLALWMPLVRPLFTGFSVVAWLVVVAVAVFLAASHWNDLTENIADRVLAPDNLILLWLIYPVIKAVHELGHAFAIKRWGGEVHEIGIMFLVFVPVPYVDASASAAFREKRKRVVVSGAGIFVELFLASVALILWVNMEPGIARTLCYNTMLIGGVSSLLFNGNPLLRFDGYYILADAVEIPNLAQRANRYLGYLFKRYAIGAKQARSPATAAGERAWFFNYGVAAFVYRMFILSVIILFVAEKFFNLGVVLAVWAAVTGLLVPTWKSLSSMFSEPLMQPHRLRAAGVIGGLVGAVFGLLVLMPVPLSARTAGVIWVPEQSQVRAQAGGFVQALLVADGAVVREGEALIELADPLLSAHVQLLEAKVKELKAQVTAEQIEDRVRAAMTKEELAAVRSDLARAQERLDQLLVRSPASGVLVIPEFRDLDGRFIPQGELLADVSDEDSATVRVSVSQQDVGLVRTRFRGVDAVVADWIVAPVPATVTRFVPAGTFKLPSPALGTAGGGTVPVDPRDPDGLRALERIFELDLELELDGVPESMLTLGAGGPLRIGQRVYVRFDFGLEPLAWQWYRDLRQLFLKRFSV